jgi:hypothetical protein
MYRSAKKDDCSNIIVVQGAQAQDCSKDIAGPMLQNYDNDSQLTYNMASITCTNTYASSNGYGNLLFKVCKDGARLTECMCVDMNGNVGIGTSTAVDRLTVEGTATVTGQLKAASAAVPSITGNTSFAGSNMTLSGQLTTASITASTFSGSNVALTGQLTGSTVSASTITNSTFTGSNVALTGQLTAPSAAVTNITGNISFAGSNVALTGSFTATSGAVASITGNTSFAGSNIALTGRLTGTSALMPSITGNTSFAGSNMTLSGRLTGTSAVMPIITGNTDFQGSNIASSGLLTGTSAVMPVITGNANFQGSNMTLQGRLDVLPNSLFVGGEQILFGRAFEIASDNSKTSNINQAYVTKCSLTAAFEAGTYVIMSQAGMSSATAGRYSDVSVSLNGAVISSNTVYHASAGYITLAPSTDMYSFTAGTHTVTLSFRRSLASQQTTTVYCKDARLLVYRAV